MKEKDIREDYEPQQLVMYVEKDDGTYGPIQTGSYLSKNYLDDFWYKKSNLEQALATQMMAGEISPIHYFMVLQELSVAELASRVGLNVFRVKRHLKAQYFKNIKLSVLKRYADVFGIPVASFFQILLLEEPQGLKSSYIKDKEPTYFQIEDNETSNPFVVLKKIKRETS